jgi:ABC-type nickel/cobalt efflux system permease component RcnA
VLVLRYILQKRISGSLESISHTTQLISYSLISLMGGVLLLRSIFLWCRGNRASEIIRPPENPHRGPLAMALAVGMIPCPGVVLLMLFSLSMNMTGLGLLLGFSMTTGMALTTSVVVGLAVWGKHLTLGRVRNREKLSHIIEQLLETLAALMVTLLGLTFLIAIL